MHRITETDVKATCQDLLDRVRSGETDDLAVTKCGQALPPVAHDHMVLRYGGTGHVRCIPC